MLTIPGAAAPALTTQLGEEVSANSHTTVATPVHKIFSQPSHLGCSRPAVDILVWLLPPNPKGVT
jgi:hypothetical protein